MGQHAEQHTDQAPCLDGTANEENGISGQADGTPAPPERTSPLAPRPSLLSQPHTAVAVVILNWNAEADTIRCARQFAEWQQVQARIWVVDNASSAKSVAAIAHACPEATILRNATNLGFAGATNRGIEAALAAGDSPVLLLNNDAFVDEAAIGQLLATMAQEPAVGMAGPLLYSMEAPPALIAAGSKNPAWHVNNLIRQVPRHDAAYAVDYVSGSVALMRAAALRKVGLLDESYFFNVEVADWCRRARASGYRVVVEPRACARHNLERSSTLRNTLYVYYLVRNRFLYIRRAYHGATWPVRLLLFAFWSVYALLLAAQLRLKGNPGRAQAVWLALLDGLAGRFGGQNVRVLAACTRPAPGEPPP